MARAIHKLTVRQVEALIKKGTPRRKSDGGGLYLKIDKEGRARWTYKFTLRGEPLERGVGSASEGGVTLKQAREKAAEAGGPAQIVSICIRRERRSVAAFVGRHSAELRPEAALSIL